MQPEQGTVLEQDSPPFLEMLLPFIWVCGNEEMMQPCLLCLHFISLVRALDRLGK